MTTEDLEVLSALIDREPVDPDVLRRVLDDPEGRRALVEFVTLRRDIQAPRPEEMDWRPAAAGAPPLTSRARPRWQLAAAAALVASAIGGGMWAERYRLRDRPPEPTRIVQLDPLPADAPGR
jgi:negative regulator of sigma E activity